MSRRLNSLSGECHHFSYWSLGSWWGRRWWGRSDRRHSWWTTTTRPEVMTLLNCGALWWQNQLWLITARETSKPLSIPRFRGPSLRSSPAGDEEVVFEDFTELSLEVDDRGDDDLKWFCSFFSTTVESCLWIFCVEIGEARWTFNSFHHFRWKRRAK